jgi:hypothetical protein
LSAVFAEHCRQARQHAGADEADAQKTDFAAPDAAGFIEILLDVAEGSARAFEKDFSCTGETNGARSSSEESVAQDLFEPADLL